MKIERIIHLFTLAASTTALGPLIAQTMALSGSQAFAIVWGAACLGIILAVVGFGQWSDDDDRGGTT